jgi:hypothetical protein
MASQGNANEREQHVAPQQLPKAMSIIADIANSSETGFPMASQGDANDCEHQKKQQKWLPNGFARRRE